LGHVEDYLRRLEDALADVPRGRRRELAAEIREHIDEAVAPGAAEADVLSVLDRLGEPEEIAAAERGRIEPRRPARLEIVALVALLPGSLLIPVFGWLVAVVLVWLSAIWTTREKLLATLAPPLGLGGVLLLSMSVGTYACYTTEHGEVCEGEPSPTMRVVLIAVLVAMVVASFVTPAILGSRLRRRSRSTAPTAEPAAV
jgi:hypothetical protein